MTPEDPLSAEMQHNHTVHSLGVEMRLPPVAGFEDPIIHTTRSGRHNINWVLQSYIPFDILSLLTGFLIAWGITEVVNHIIYGREFLASFSAFAPIKLAEFVMISSGVILSFQHNGHYRIRMPFWSEAGDITKTLAFAVAADSFLQFSTKQDFSRLCLISAWAISALLIIAARSFMRAYLRRKGLWKISVLLVGSGQTAAEASLALASEPGLGYEIVAQTKNLLQDFMLAGRSWTTLCNMHKTDYVMIALDGHDLANAQQPIAQLMREDIPFSVSPPLHHIPVHGMQQQYFFNHDVMLFTRTSGLEKPLPVILKRLMDIMLSGIAVIVLSPAFLILTALVKRDGGPAFYGHMRIGKNGKKFYCLKFRSMVAGDSQAVLKEHLAKNPELMAEWQATQKLKDDPRITKVGKVLRKLSLDEIPQFFNILKGDMSLVGPRPIVDNEVPKYHSDIAYYYRVRPGVTGLWQVSGRNDVSYAQRVQMDSWYVRNWSLWHDIAIIFKTFPALLRSGAY